MSTNASGLLLHHPDGQTFRFDPGALCLELLVTGGGGWLSRLELLHAPADLVAWLPGSRLADGWRLPAEIEVTAEELTAIKQLRAALWRIAVELTSGGEPAPADLALINQVAAQPPMIPWIAPQGRQRAWAAPVTGAQIASTFARNAVELLAGRGAERLRRCAGDNCYLVFVDTSRPGRRRWCSMERCGNRDKVRAFRQRHQPAAPDPSEETR